MAGLTTLDKNIEKTCLDVLLFPDLCGGKIDTLKFLDASRGVAALIDKFGRLLLPLSRDISNNIDKIQISYCKNGEKHNFIEDLILCDEKQKGAAVNALLWLQRALHFILIFFKNVLKDAEKSESLRKHITSAYSQTLEPYHGFWSRKLCGVFLEFIPNRSQLVVALGGKKEDNEVLKDIEIYIKNLEVVVYHIINFYRESGLATDSKVS